VGPANVYVFSSDPIMLFDSGPNTAAALNALTLGLARLDLALGQVARVVISHGHPHHYGLAPTIREISGAAVYVGRADLPKINERANRYATGALLMEAGTPVDVLLEMDQERKRTRELHPRIEDAIPLDGGERIGFDDFELEVLHLPGHTSGHVCLLERERRILFAGRHPARPHHAESAAGTHPGGHHRQAQEPGGIRKGEVAARLGVRPASPFELARAMFTDLEGFDNCLAVSEVVAHLDLLEADGRAERVVKGGVTRYRAAERG